MLPASHTETMVDDRLQEAFSDDVGSLWCRPIAVLDRPPDSLSFLRGERARDVCLGNHTLTDPPKDFVHPHVPCIIRNTIHSDKGSPLILGLDDIVDIVGDGVELTVDVTPDGHGDCVRCVRTGDADGRGSGIRKLFVKPHEQKMTLSDFRHHLREQESSYTTNSAGHTDINGLGVLQIGPGSDHSLNRVEKKVVYYSRQNDCLRTEMNSLFSTNIFPPSLGFAEEVFDTGPPDAVNLWIGNQRSVSSMHKVGCWRFHHIQKEGHSLKRNEGCLDLKSRTITRTSSMYAKGRRSSSSALLLMSCSCTKGSSCLVHSAGVRAEDGRSSLTGTRRQSGSSECESQMRVKSISLLAEF